MTGVAGSPWYSNIYFANDAQADLAAGETTKVATFWDSLRSHMVSGCTITVETEIPMIDEHDGKMIGVHVGAGATLTGTGVGERLPGQVQALGQLFTAGFVNGRKVRGRIFIPGVLEGDSQNGVPSVTANNAFATALTALRTGTPSLTIWSRPVKTASPGSPIRDGSHWNVNGSAVWSQWATMRSRRD